MAEERLDYIIRRKVNNISYYVTSLQEKLFDNFTELYTLKIINNKITIRPGKRILEYKMRGDKIYNCELERCFPEEETISSLVKNIYFSSYDLANTIIENIEKILKSFKKGKLRDFILYRRLGIRPKIKEDVDLFTKSLVGSIIYVEKDLPYPSIEINLIFENEKNLYIFGLKLGAGKRLYILSKIEKKEASFQYPTYL